MSSRIFATFLVALMLTLTGVAWASQAGDAGTPHIPATCTFQHFRPFASKVWSPTHWRRDKVHKATFRAYHKRLNCAPPKHRKAMKDLWMKDKSAFNLHRKHRLFRENIDKYNCGGSYWATPCEIPLNESGYGEGGTNLYGLKDAWGLQGCTKWGPTAESASKHYQDICAHRHWDDYGRGGWPPY